MVTPEYLATLRIPLLRGRNLSESDAPKAPLVCLIDAKFAQRFFPNQDPIGQEIEMYGGAARIVGIVGTIRGSTLEDGSRPVAYYSMAQIPLFANVGVVVRSRVSAGAAVYAKSCQSCHGAQGAGKPQDQLTGGIGTLATAKPVKTPVSYWPVATTLFDYIRRAMPIASPQSLTNDEVYAVTAYILSIDGIVPQDAVLDAKSLPRVKMPNKDGFVSWWPKAPR